MHYNLRNTCHPHSLTQLAIDLARRREAHIGAGYQPTISRAGLGSKAAADAAAKSVKEPAFASYTYRH